MVDSQSGRVIDFFLNVGASSSSAASPKDKRPTFLIS